MSKNSKILKRFNNMRGEFADLNIYSDRPFLNMLSTALREYAATKSLKQFEEDYNCKIIYDDIKDGIRTVHFNDESCKTGFYLKYNK